MHLVFVSSPFSDDPPRRIEQAKRVMGALVQTTPLSCFFSPVLHFPAFMDEATQRDHALAYCREMIFRSDSVLFVVGESGRLSAGQECERAWARLFAKPTAEKPLAWFDRCSTGARDDI